jgi:hypothetical protein
LAYPQELSKILWTEHRAFLCLYVDLYSFDILYILYSLYITYVRNDNW